VSAASATAASIIPQLLAESGGAPPSLLEWQGRLEAWSARAMHSTDLAAAASAPTAAAFVLRLLALAASGKDPAHQENAGPTFTSGLSMGAASLCAGPSTGPISQNSHKPASSLLTQDASSDPIGRAFSAAVPLVRLLQAFGSSARSVPALLDVLVGSESTVPHLRHAVDAACTAVLAALSCPYDLGVAQLDGLGRAVLSALVKSIPGLPQPMPLDTKNSSSLQPAVRAMGALLPVEHDSSAASSAVALSLSTHVLPSLHRSLPLVALLQV
jgi:hypothetical protein